MAKQATTTGLDEDRLISLGKISGVFGVKGWIKVHSYTDPIENIIKYKVWQIKHQGQWRQVELTGKRQAKTVVAKIVGLDDRDEAMLYHGDEIAIFPEQLEQLKQGEYYWRQLIGLRVVTTEGIELGKVHHLLETGANDVLVIQEANEAANEDCRERLIPFTHGHAVTDVDLSTGTITVDWDPEF